MSKYSSLSTFIKGVMHVNEPLMDGERLMLNALLVSVNYKTACSHPGNQELMALTNRGFRAVQKILKRLRDKTLIETMEQGDGRGHATVHRFRIEDERYPRPRTPEGVDSDEDPDGLGRKPRPVEGVVPDEKPRTGKRKPRTKSEKPRTEGAETTNKLETPLPKTASTGTSSTPSGNGGGGNSWKPADKEDVEYVMAAFRDRTGKELPREVAESLFKVKKCRPVAICIAVDRWLMNRTKGFVGLEHPEQFIAAELFSKDSGEYLYYDRDAMTWDEQEALKGKFRQEGEWRDVERQVATGQMDEVDTPMTQAEFDAAIAAGEAMF